MLFRSLTANTLLPVVSTNGAFATDKVNVSNLANFILAGAGNSFANVNISQLSYNVVNAAQPNITSVGTLNSLNVVGDSNLGPVSGVTILGGNNGYFLQTDGTGNLTWAAGGGGGGNGSPGGANTQVQFNDSGVFGGDPGFTYNKITNTLTVENLASGNTIDDTITAAGSLSVTGNIVSLGNIVGNYFIGNGAGLTDITTETANYVRQNTQANITALGNLQYLYIDGETVSLGNIETSGDIIGGNLNAAANIYAGNGTITNKLTVNGNLYVPKPGVVRITGNINTAGSNSINLGTISNIHISGGLNGY